MVSRRLLGRLAEASSSLARTQHLQDAVVRGDQLVTRKAIDVREAQRRAVVGEQLAVLVCDQLDVPARLRGPGRHARAPRQASSRSQMVS